MTNKRLFILAIMTVFIAIKPVSLQSKGFSIDDIRNFVISENPNKRDSKRQVLAENRLDFLKEVTTLKRKIGIEGMEISEAPFIDGVFDYALEYNSLRHTLFWQRFFSSSIILTGRMKSDSPIIVYYSAILDLALFTRWEKKEKDTYKITWADVKSGKGYITNSDSSECAAPYLQADRDLHIFDIAIASDDFGRAFYSKHPSFSSRANPQELSENASRVELLEDCFDIDGYLWSQKHKYFTTKKIKALSLLMDVIKYENPKPYLTKFIDNTQYSEVSNEFSKLPVSFRQNLEIYSILADANSPSKLALILYNPHNPRALGFFRLNISNTSFIDSLGFVSINPVNRKLINNIRSTPQK